MPKLELIKWLDHAKFSSSGWRDKNQMKDLTPVRLKTVGWVVKETDEHIVVVNTIGKHHYQNEFCIVKGAILKRKEIA